MVNAKLEQNKRHEPAVSVIVPVFNTKKYLQECLDSLVAQTLQEIEVICVDNGSTDGSYEFLVDYAKVHENIFVMKHTEGRQGGARNAGLEVAKGSYIGFVDSDDFVSPDMFRTMYETAEANAAQVAVCNIQYFHMDSGYGRSALPRSVLDAPGAASIQQKPKLLSNLTICNKIFSRRLIDRYEIRFPQGYYHEDQFFVIVALTKAERISTIPASLYFYRKGRQGSVSEYRGPDSLHIFSVMEMIEHYIAHSQGDSQLKEIISEVKVQRLLQAYRLTDPAHRRSFFAEMKKQFQAAGLGDSCQLLSRPEWREYQIVRRSGYLIYNMYLTTRARYGKLREYVVHAK